MSVTPRSSALLTTRRDSARSIRPPKLLAPRPTRETSGPECPSLRFCMLSTAPLPTSSADIIGGESRHVDDLSVVRGQRNDLHRTVETDQHRADHRRPAELHQQS